MYLAAQGISYTGSFPRVSFLEGVIPIAAGIQVLGPELLTSGRFSKLQYACPALIDVTSSSVDPTRLGGSVKRLSCYSFLPASMA